MGFWIYTFCSGIAFYSYSKMFSVSVKDTADELGYFNISEKKKRSLGKEVVNFLLSFIPFVSTFGALCFLGLSIYLSVGNKKDIEGVFERNPHYLKASQAKEVLEHREKLYNLNTLEDAMKIDGASDEVVREEVKKIKEEGCVPTPKELKKVKAMSAAEEWLIGVELDTSLTDSEKESLYRSYVKDFSKNKSSDKAIQKTLKMVYRKEE